jgi:hypothetical protein
MSAGVNGEVFVAFPNMAGFLSGVVGTGGEVIFVFPLSIAARCGSSSAACSRQ